MDLKELLGEELYNQVMEKAGDNKLAVVSDGNWFPKDKFDAKNDEVKDLKNQLKTRDTQLDALKSSAADHDALKQQIQTLQDENKNKDTEYQEKLDKQSFDFALKDALRGAQAKNPRAVTALLNTEAIKLDGDKLLGLEEQLNSLKESDGYLFAEKEEPAGLSGRSPKGAGQQLPGTYNKPNPFKKESLNLTEQGRLFREDPDLAKKLQAQA
ncbi:phage scaffolding protein [Jeotgalibacillus soli]|uniref:Phage minor structural protein gp20 n=1 Tax=Jeotgalibacillus soli TaxID=889306 RepID=A0A0C2R670_9BACL|nr:phage scaffolding protein [Jeotgalibacillus soli]KIL45755.1 phage minor structural protein gp20 [Jeotgalibacillus soli]